MIIRPATAEDGPTVAAVRLQSWRTTYRGVVPDSYLDTMDANEPLWCEIASGEEPGTELCVCEVEARIVGFACFGPARPLQFDFSGELYATYFLREAIGKGYGAAVMLAATNGLKRLGHDDMILWVLESNGRAQRFYEQFGGVRVENSRQSFQIDGKTFWEVAYGFRPLPVASVNG